MTQTTSPVPRLAPPGAGIPAVERLVGGAIFAVRRALGDPARFSAEFARERARIAALCDGLDGAALSARVLIPRLRGLEDSSRYWSVYMTLDHLRIVNLQIASIMHSLLQGVAPQGRASTAAVKPTPEVGPAVVAEHEAACDAVLSVAAGRRTLRTACRYAHPWFGPLDAAGWHAMSAAHMGIHRVQVERILSPRRPA